MRRSGRGKCRWREERIIGRKRNKRRKVNMRMDISNKEEAEDQKLLRKETDLGKERERKLLIGKTRNQEE